MAEAGTVTEAEILASVIVPDKGDMTAAAARLILRWRFSDRDMRRMRTLLNRNNKGLLTPGEQADLEKYRRVGMLLDLLQAKARLSLEYAESDS